MSAFGDSVRWRRKSLGMSQGDLAAKVRVNHRRVTQSYISRLENGLLDPKLSTVCSIARALRVKDWQLVAGYNSVEFWRGYLDLSPSQKREVQRIINWYSERRDQ